MVSAFVQMLMSFDEEHPPDARSHLTRFRHMRVSAKRMSLWATLFSRVEKEKAMRRLEMSIVSIMCRCTR